MKYLIFGGTGFIGTHLAKYIASQGVAISNIFSFDIKIKTNDHSSFNVIDVQKPINTDIINTHLQDLSDSVIFNLAAVHTTPGHPDHEYFETNIWGAENICNFARQNHISTIVFTSSIAPYGASESLKTEDTLPMPTTPYGISKLTAEYIHKIWQAEDPENRRLFIVRPGVVFGQGEGGNFTRLYQALKSKKFFYPGRKDTIKAAVYVKDVVRILYQAAHDTALKQDTYNLTLYPAPTIQEICDTMAAVANVTKPKIVMPAWLLKLAAGTLFILAKGVGKTINGIHPDRVKKLMISTNISGNKLSQSQYHLNYNLQQAINDWYINCSEKELA